MKNYTAKQSLRTFCIPEVAEATKLFRDFEVSGVAETIKNYQERGFEIQRVLESIPTPMPGSPPGGMQAVSRRGAISACVYHSPFRVSRPFIPPEDYQPHAPEKARSAHDHSERRPDRAVC